MKKAVIYGFLNFPRMSASANYAQYLALALKKIGYEVTVISSGKIGLCDYDEGKCGYYYKGIRFEKIELSKGKIRHYLDYYLRLGKYFVSVMEKMQLDSKDIVIGYIPDGIAVSHVQHFCKKKNLKICQCVDEYFNDSEIATWPVLRKMGYKLAMNKVIFKSDLIFPISSYLETYFKRNGCKTFVLPIMADTSEFDYKGKKTKNKIKIIYPTNGHIKDGMNEMINAFLNLTVCEQEQLEFHVTGIKKTDLMYSASEAEREFIEKRMIFHQWMEYEELIALYCEMDFLFLVREESRMTMANFPSKVPEVMMQGVIPIVSRVGDYTKYYLTHMWDSIIIDENSSDKCCEAIKQAISMSTEERQKMSYNARKCVEIKFDYRNWCNRLAEAIKQISDE